MLCGAPRKIGDGMGGDHLSTQSPLVAISRERKKKRAGDVSDKYYQLLKKWNKPADGGGGDLDNFELHDPELAWRVWRDMEMTGWRFLPSEILAQPEALWRDLMTLVMANSRVKEFLKSG